MKSCAIFQEISAKSYSNFSSRRFFAHLFFSFKNSEGCKRISFHLAHEAHSLLLWHTLLEKITLSQIEVLRKSLRIAAHRAAMLKDARGKTRFILSCAIFLSPSLGDGARKPIAIERDIVPSIASNDSTIQCGRGVKG